MAAPTKFTQSFLFQVVVYTAVIFGVMFWSGRTTQKTIYDTFVVHVEGNVIPVANIARSERFFQKVLDFQILRPDIRTAPTSNIENRAAVGVQLPDGAKVFFETDAKSGAASHAPIVTVLRVRNGFKKLQQTLVSRSGRPEYRNTQRNYLSEMDPEMVSEIVTRRWGDEFVVTDPDNNRFIFFLPLRRSMSRY